MLVAINTIGLILNLAGVIFLFRYGMPYRVRTNGKTAITKMLANAAETIQLERRYARLGRVGLILIVLGTICQIYVGIVTLCPTFYR